MTKLNPYLTFNGNAKEAMEFYKSVFGGELTLQTFGETPVEGPEAYKDKIVHAVLTSGDVMFMSSDSMPDQAVDIGGNVSMSLVGSDESKLTEYFNGLAVGGEVTMPMAKQFWGDTFGMLKDKFDINWMINVSKQ